MRRLGLAPERAGESGLAQLLAGIASDAAREAATLRAQATELAEKLLAEAEERAQRIETSADAEGRAEGLREARRRIARAEIEARRASLELREDHLARAVEQAVARLGGRLEADGALAAAWVRAAARALGEPAPRLRLDPETRARIEPHLGRELTPAFEERPGLGPGVVVASGDGRREVDATPGGVLARRADLARSAAAAELFADVPEPVP